MKTDVLFQLDIENYMSIEPDEICETKFSIDFDKLSLTTLLILFKCLIGITKILSHKKREYPTIINL